MPFDDAGSKFLPPKPPSRKMLADIWEMLWWPTWHHLKHFAGLVLCAAPGGGLAFLVYWGTGSANPLSFALMGTAVFAPTVPLVRRFEARRKRTRQLWRMIAL